MGHIPHTQLAPIKASASFVIRARWRCPHSFHGRGAEERDEEPGQGEVQEQRFSLLSMEG